MSTLGAQHGINLPLTCYTTLASELSPLVQLLHFYVQILLDLILKYFRLSNLLSRVTSRFQTILVSNSPTQIPIIPKIFWTEMFAIIEISNDFGSYTIIEFQICVPNLCCVRRQTHHTSLKQIAALISHRYPPQYFDEAPA